MSIRVCLRKATHLERFAENMDCSSFAGTPIRFGDAIVGVLSRAWVEDGSLWGELSISSPEIEALVVQKIP